MEITPQILPTHAFQLESVSPKGIPISGLTELTPNCLSQDKYSSRVMAIHLSLSWKWLMLTILIYSHTRPPCYMKMTNADHSDLQLRSSTLLRLHAMTCSVLYGAWWNAHTRLIISPDWWSTNINWILLVGLAPQISNIRKEGIWLKLIAWKRRKGPDIN